MAVCSHPAPSLHLGSPGSQAGTAAHTGGWSCHPNNHNNPHTYLLGDYRCVKWQLPLPITVMASEPQFSPPPILRCYWGLWMGQEIPGNFLLRVHLFSSPPLLLPPPSSPSYPPAVFFSPWNCYVYIFSIFFFFLYWQVCSDCTLISDSHVYLTFSLQACFCLVFRHSLIAKSGMQWLCS